MRRFHFSGAPAAVAAALARCHVRADVRGVLELDAAVEVWIEGDLPDLPAAVQVAELPLEACVSDGREHDAPIVIADDLLVRPPWVASPPAFAGIELVVPRGGAFGSGEHDSTRAALEALHCCWRPVDSFADVGTGSGILAAYARARGVPRLLACDIDAAAVRTASGLLPEAIVRCGGPDVLPGPVDAVVANLTGAELAACLDGILGLWNRRGPCVLSGLRAGEDTAIIARLPAAPVGRINRGAFTALIVSLAK